MLGIFARRRDRANPNVDIRADSNGAATIRKSMQEETMPVRTTVVGSWWIYPEDAADLRAYHDGKLSKQASDAFLNRVASKAISEQRSLDQNEWSGGEYFTDEFILHMYKCLTGLQVDKPQEAVVFDYDDMAHAKIVGEITAPGLGYLANYRREKNLPGGVKKAAVVAAYEVAVAGRDQLDKLKPQVGNINRIINAELRGMADEGCPNVQLDAPIFAVEVNMGTMTAKEAADLIAPCFEGVKAKKSVHFWSAWWTRAAT